MVFDIKEKIVIITGGASGIGFHLAKEFLRNGAKGISLADINVEYGQKAIQEIETEFGANKAIFIPTDVKIFKQFEDAFKKTLQVFKNIDVLINNAGILNDATWEEEIAINVNGTIHGLLLGLDKYLTQYKQGDEAVILNLSSTGGCEGFGHIPVYCATKHAIIGLTRSFGIPEFYEETKIRIVAICPGVTNTPMISEMSGRNLGERHQKFWKSLFNKYPTQEPEFLAKEALKVIRLAPNGTFWVVEGGDPAFQFVIPDYRTMKDNTIDKLESS